MGPDNSPLPPDLRERERPLTAAMKLRKVCPVLDETPGTQPVSHRLLHRLTGPLDKVVALFAYLVIWLSVHVVGVQSRMGHTQKPILKRGSTTNRHTTETLNGYCNPSSPRPLTSSPPRRRRSQQRKKRRRRRERRWMKKRKS